MISSFQFPVPGTKCPTHSWEISCRDSGLLQLPLDVGDSILGVFMVIPIFGRDRDNPVFMDMVVYPDDVLSGIRVRV